MKILILLISLVSLNGCGSFPARTCWEGETPSEQQARVDRSQQLRQEIRGWQELKMGAVMGHDYWVSVDAAIAKKERELRELELPACEN